MIEFVPTYVGIIKEFKWRHVVIFLQDENLFTLVVQAYNVFISVSKYHIRCYPLKPHSDRREAEKVVGKRKYHIFN